MHTEGIDLVTVKPIV